VDKPDARQKLVRKLLNQGIPRMSGKKSPPFRGVV
jgi:hypothetical protein